MSNWTFQAACENEGSRRTTTLLFDFILGSGCDSEREGSSWPQGLPHPPSHIIFFRNVIYLQPLTLENNSWHAGEQSQELKSWLSSFTQMSEDPYWLGKKPYWEVNKQTTTQRSCREILTSQRWEISSCTKLNNVKFQILHLGQGTEWSLGQ